MGTARRHNQLFGLRLTELVRVSVEKKETTPTNCTNHRDINQMPVVIKQLASIHVCCLTEEGESGIRNQQAGFCLGRGCLDHIFNLRWALEQCHTYRKAKIAVFFDFQSAFNSADRPNLFDIFPKKDVPMKYMAMLHDLHLNTSASTVTCRISSRRQELFRSLPHICSAFSRTLPPSIQSLYLTMQG